MKIIIVIILLMSVFFSLSCLVKKTPFQVYFCNTKGYTLKEKSLKIDKVKAIEIFSNWYAKQYNTSPKLALGRHEYILDDDYVFYNTKDKFAKGAPTIGYYVDGNTGKVELKGDPNIFIRRQGEGFSVIEIK